MFSPLVRLFAEFILAQSYDLINEKTQDVVVLWQNLPVFFQNIVDLLLFYFVKNLDLLRVSRVSQFLHTFLFIFVCTILTNSTSFVEFYFNLLP